MSELLTEISGRTAFLTLNRPDKRNALNAELIAALKDAFRATDANEDVRAVVVRGAGKDFCSGADLASLQKIAESSYEENLEDARSLAELFTIIRSVQAPVIAAVHGRALAGGCGLATACDLVVATETAQFGYPEVKIGFVPAIVMAFLRRNISEKRAFEMATQGFEFSAERAFEIGLVNKLFAEDGFENAAAEYASIYDRLSLSAVRMSKRLLYSIDGSDFDESMEAGSVTNAEARMTEDCKTGISRFLDSTAKK